MRLVEDPDFSDPLLPSGFAHVHAQMKISLTTTVPFVTVVA